MTDSDRHEKLRSTIEEIASAQKTTGWAVALRDYESDFRFSLNGDRLFHAASTIKVAVLLKRREGNTPFYHQILSGRRFSGGRAF